MPLWFFAGFVDDADQHSANAYNETKAQAGYNIIITGTDGYNTTISSKDYPQQQLPACKFPEWYPYC